MYCILIWKLQGKIRFKNWVYESWFPGDWKDLFNDSKKVKEKNRCYFEDRQLHGESRPLPWQYKPLQLLSSLFFFFLPVWVFMCMYVCVILLQIYYFIVHKILLIMVQFNFVLEIFFKPFIYLLEIKRLW